MAGFYWVGSRYLGEGLLFQGAFRKGEDVKFQTVYFFCGAGTLAVLGITPPCVGLRFQVCVCVRNSSIRCCPRVAQHRDGWKSVLDVKLEVRQGGWDHFSTRFFVQQRPP